jgi:uncharacterized protein
MKKVKHRKQGGYMTVVLQVLFLLLMIYTLLLLFLYLRQKQMVYIPYSTINSTPETVGLAYKEVTVETRDGLNICAWFVGDDTPPNKDVIFLCHGNGGNISHRLNNFLAFESLGLRTFIFDYRGYGKSEGSPTEEGTYMDSEAALEHLIKVENIPPERIIIMGRSLGGPIAARLATKVQVKALILESTFTSITDLGAQWYPFLPVRALSRYKYNTLEYLKNIKPMPVLIVHSPQDELIPYDHGVALWEAASDPKQFLKIAGTHNEGFVTDGDTYTSGLLLFLTQ